MDSALTRRLTTRWRHYVWSVGVGLVAAGFAVSAAFEPGTLTATTRNAVRTTAAAYYPGLAWPHAAGLVMLLYHGPYVAGLFASILGFSLASILLHGWQAWSVTETTSFDHDASLETVESILAAVAAHAAVLAAAAYLPAVGFFAAIGDLVNPFGTWAALGPLLVAGFGVAGGLAAATAGVLKDGVGRGTIAIVGLLLPLAGLQYGHVTPARHPSVGFTGSAATLALFAGICWWLLRRRAE
jgi:hypothetical protein